jgi:uncharacterized cupin superfamily protein
VSKPIVNLADLRPQPLAPAFQPTGEAATRYAPRIAPIAAGLGAQKLGYNLTVLAPGMRAFPAHNHRVNEEMFLVLEGDGEVRIGAQVHAIRAGDIVACPPGGPETAHQIRNTGSVDLRYLSVSTMQYPEIVDYPDSGKFGVRGEFKDADGKPHTFRVIGRAGESVDYWEGE